MCIENKRTVIIGSDGYIGSYLCRQFYALDSSTICLGKSDEICFDLLNEDSWIFEPNIKFAIICAGITNISKCEKYPDMTSHININKTFKLVRYLISLGIIPIIFSSDYVFDGNQGNYEENSITKPLNQYGLQKANLEKSLLDRFSDQCIILRLSKVYGNELFQKTFVSEMIELFINKKKIKAAIDQVFCPIHLNDIFKTIRFLQNNNLKGLFNLCSPKVYQRYQIAKLISDLFEFDSTLIEKILLSDLREDFKRPLNTSMISKRLNLNYVSSVENNLKKLHENYERKRFMAKNGQYVR